MELNLSCFAVSKSRATAKAEFKFLNSILACKFLAPRCFTEYARSSWRFRAV